MSPRSFPLPLAFRCAAGAGHGGWRNLLSERHRPIRQAGHHRLTTAGWASCWPARACEVIHAAKDCEDKTETDYTLSVTDSGKTRIGVTQHYYGAELQRQEPIISPSCRRRKGGAIIRKSFPTWPRARGPVGDLITQFDTYPGLEQFTVDIDNYSVVDGKYLYFDLPFTPSLFPVSADQRALPIVYLAGTAKTPFAPRSNCRPVSGMWSSPPRATRSMARRAAAKRK